MVGVSRPQRQLRAMPSFLLRCQASEDWIIASLELPEGTLRPPCKPKHRTQGLPSFLEELSSRTFHGETKLRVQHQGFREGVEGHHCQGTGGPSE